MSWIEDMGWDLDPENIPEQKYWKTKDGQILLPEQMSLEHMERVLTLVVNRDFDGDLAKTLNSMPLMKKMSDLIALIKGEK